MAPILCNIVFRGKATHINLLYYSSITSAKFFFAMSLLSVFVIHFDEFTPVRKCHQRALESLQATLDVEVKGKAEGLKLKKKLEADINELELQVELFTKSNAELSKSSKKMQLQIKV